MRSTSHSRSSSSARRPDAPVEEGQTFSSRTVTSATSGVMVPSWRSRAHVLQFDGDGAADELGDDGGDVLVGVLAIELVDREFAEDVRRLLLASTLEFVDDLGQRALARQAVESRAASCQQVGRDQPIFHVVGKVHAKAQRLETGTRHRQASPARLASLRRAAPHSQFSRLRVAREFGDARPQQ